MIESLRAVRWAGQEVDGRLAVTAAATEDLAVDSQCGGGLIPRAPVSGCYVVQVKLLWQKVLLFVLEAPVGVTDV